jgi:hypothetical protein
VFNGNSVIIGPAPPSSPISIITSLRTQTVGEVFNPENAVPQFIVFYEGSPYATFDLLRVRTVCAAGTAVPLIAVAIYCRMRFVGLRNEGEVLVENAVVEYTYQSSNEYALMDFGDQMRDVVSVRLELLSVVAVVVPVPEILGFLVASVSFDDMDIMAYPAL